MRTHHSALSRRRRRLTFVVLLALACLSANGLDAQSVKLPLKAIQVTRFPQAESLGLSETFLESFNQGILKFLPKTKVAESVVEQGAAIPEDEAANSILVEGKLVELKKIGTGGVVVSEISLYRLSDHTLITTFTAKAPFKGSPFNKDRNIGEFTGGRTAFEIQRALKKLKPEA